MKNLSVKLAIHLEKIVSQKSRENFPLKKSRSKCLIDP